MCTLQGEGEGGEECGRMGGPRGRQIQRSCGYNTGKNEARACRDPVVEHSCAAQMLSCSQNWVDHLTV